MIALTGELGPKAERGGPVSTQSRNGVEGEGSPGAHFSTSSSLLPSAWLLVFTALGEAFGTPLPLLGKHPEMSHIGHARYPYPQSPGQFCFRMISSRWATSQNTTGSLKGLVDYTCHPHTQDAEAGQLP